MKFLFLLLSTWATSQVPEHVQDFINEYTPIAKEIEKEFGVPVAVTLGISSYESGFGRSYNCKNRNNFFGMKDFSVKTADKNWSWKVYKNKKESFRDFGRLLMTTKRYQVLRSLDKNDYKQWAKLIAGCGYNNSENYPGRIIYLIERWKY